MTGHWVPSPNISCLDNYIRFKPVCQLFHILGNRLFVMAVGASSFAIPQWWLAEKLVGKAYEAWVINRVGVSASFGQGPGAGIVAGRVQHSQPIEVGEALGSQREVGEVLRTARANRKSGDFRV